MNPQTTKVEQKAQAPDRLAKESRVHVVRLMGGLGNQMFQYAFGRQLSARSGIDVKFDVSNGFKHDPYRRHLSLGDFNTTLVEAHSREIPFGMSWNSPWHRIAKLGWHAVPSAWQQVVYDADPFQFDPSLFASKRSSAYYFGYWQNERYFSQIAETIRQDFTLLRAPPTSTAILMREMASCRSISMHVRRNHGVSTSGELIQKGRDLHGACSVEYFHAALEKVGFEPGTVCFIFSDSPAWAEANLRLPVPAKFVSKNFEASDAEELLLMAACKHHVIANSSFSWWGAWLGRNPGKIVVAPRRWLAGSPETAGDICPPSWIRV